MVDVDRLRGPLRIEIAPAGSASVFNSAGPSIDVAEVPCLFDADGPCANAVKDAQRTKTHAGTVHTLSLIWGTRALPGRAAAAESWYRSLLQAQNVSVESCVGG